MSKNATALNAVNRAQLAQAKALDDIQSIYNGLCASVRHHIAVDKLSVLEQLSMSLDVLAQARGEAVNDR